MTTAASDSCDATASRASRRQRVSTRGVRLRDRDIDILLALAKMRLLKTSNLTVLYFSAKGTCQKRLRKLFDAGLVRTIVTDLAADNRYALTPLGHALLVEALPDEDVPDFRPAPRIDGRGLAHLELVNRYRIALAKGATAASVELVAFVPEWELRSAEPTAPLIPDAALTLRVDGRDHGIAMEVDTGSEPPATVVRKVERYEAAVLARRRVGGLLAPTVVIIASSARRARSLARALANAGRGRAIVGAAPAVLADGGLASGLSTAGELAKTSGPIGAEAFPLGLRAVLSLQRHVRAPGRRVG
jgi:hypothetical protein